VNGFTNVVVAWMPRNVPAPRKLARHLIGRMPECLVVQEARERPYLDLRPVFNQVVFQRTAATSRGIGVFFEASVLISLLLMI
jgi:hypothetical protein